MKKLKLLFAFCALLLGWSNVQADTALLTEADGWQKVTSLTDVSNHYYIIVDNSQDLMLGAAKGVNQSTKWYSLGIFYQTSISPTSVDIPQKTWIIEPNGDTSFALRNLEQSERVFMTEWNASYRFDTNDIYVPDGNWTLANFAYNGDYWTIENGHDRGKYLGPWDEDLAITELVNGQETAGNKSGNFIGRYQIYAISRDRFKQNLIDNASSSNLADLTSYYVTNATFDRGNRNGWTETGSGGNNNTNNSGCEIYHRTGFNIYQNLTVPKGKYKVSIQATGSTSGIVYGTSGENTVSTNITTGNAANFQESTLAFIKNRYHGRITTDEILVADGSLTIGFKDETTNQWDVFDNFKIYLTDPYLSVIAKPIPANGDLEANQWYVYDVVSDGNYALSATEGIVYTQTDQLRNTASTADATSMVELTVGQFFFKSSTAQTLTITPQTYTYELGAITAQNIAENSFIPNLTTFTLTYGNAVTNDLGASLEVIGSSNASLKKNGSEVAVGTLTANNTAKTLTATFDDVELERNANDYSIVIPAGVFGYEGKATNTEFSVNFNTGAIADGVYFFQIKDTQTYLSRGGDWGTQAIVSNYGIHFEAVLQSNGSYTLKSIDASLHAGTGKYLRYADDAARTNQASYNWEVEATEGGVYLKPDATHYLTTAIDNTYEYTYLPQTETEAEAVVWVPINKATYASNLVAAKNAEIAAVAAQAGITAANEAELKSILSEDYGETDMTSRIKNASLNNSVDNWENKKYGANQQKNITKGSVAEIWEGAGGAYQTINGLEKGLYKISLHATWRAGLKTNADNIKDEADVNAWIYANNCQTQVKSWWDGGHSIDNRDEMKASGNTYLNEVFVYISEGEDLTIGLASPATINDAAWVPFFGWELKYYEAKPTAEQKTALAEAITNAEAKTLGFEYGEYAPYNNTDALTKLATAKAINLENVSGTEVVAVTADLNGASWTANTEEVNAIRWNKAEDYSSEGENKVPTGGFIGSDANSRISHNPTSNAGLAGLTQSMALMVVANTNATYGETEGYTLPLKATTVYEFKFKYAGWGECGTPTITILKGSETVKSVTLDAPAKTGNNNTDAWEPASVVFQTNAAGDYKVKFSTSDGRNAFGDLELKKTSDVSVTVGSYGYATYVNKDYDLDFSSTSIEAYKVKVSTKGVATLTKVNNVPAKTPVLLYKEGGATENIPVMTGAAAVTENDLVAGNSTTATEGVATTDGEYTNMILNVVDEKIGFYFANGQTVAENRAYLHIATTLAPDAVGGSSTARMAMRFAGDITGINQVENGELKIEKSLPAKRIVKGKLIIEQKGKKFNAAGALVD